MNADLTDRYAQLFSEIEERLSRGKLIVAVDGRCGAGKSTLGEVLKGRYDCNVFHMDDFFLMPSMRTPERLAIPGENVDHERFLSEVLLPCYYGETVRYRRYDCHEGRMLPAVEVSPGALTVVEGSYSLHPDLAPYYGLKVFLDISEEEQRARIIKRNGQEAASRFFSTWIPMEEAYFRAYRIRELCDAVCDATVR